MIKWGAVLDTLARYTMNNSVGIYQLVANQQDGRKKMIVYDDIEPVEKVKIYDKGVDVQPYTDTYEEFHLAYRYGEAVPYPLNWQEPLRAECLHFLECIEQGVPSRSSGVEGLKVIQVIEAAQRSLFNSGTREEITWESIQTTNA